jgi:hypothetical protein
MAANSYMGIYLIMINCRHIFSWSFFLLPLLVVTVLRPAVSATVFSLGEPDGSAEEFRLDFSATPANSPFIFEVGRPIGEIPALIAGPTEDNRGSLQPNENNPLTLRFNLEMPVESYFSLAVAEYQSYYANTDISYSVSANGTLVYSRRFAARTNEGYDGNGPQLVDEFPIPSTALRRGTNDITIRVASGDWIALDSMELTTISGYDVEIPLDPRATYLWPHMDPPIEFEPPLGFVFVDPSGELGYLDALPVDLSTLIPNRPIVPGDYLKLESYGTFCLTNPDCHQRSNTLTGVFSATPTLLTVESAVGVDRIPDVVPEDISDMQGRFTAAHTADRGGYPLDIPQDFLIHGASESEATVVRVPDHASQLFLSTHDNLWFDNYVPEGEVFGLRVSVLPQGDFNFDGELDETDINRLSQAVANQDPEDRFDVDSNGLLDFADLVYYLGTVFATAPGDANLDGVVDSDDFQIWAQARFSQEQGWSAGDFTGDGLVDARDFNVWNRYKSRPPVVPIPVPDTYPRFLIHVSLCLFIRGLSYPRRPRHDHDVRLS